MNLEVCSTEYLRDLFRKLEKENQYLKALLDKAEIPYAHNEDRSYSYLAIII